MWKFFISHTQKLSPCHQCSIKATDRKGRKVLIMKCVSYTPLPCSTCNTYSRIEKQKGCLLPVANTLWKPFKELSKGLNLGFIQKINLANLQVQNKNTNFATVNFRRFIKIALAGFGLLSFTGFKPVFICTKKFKK